MSVKSWQRLGLVGFALWLTGLVGEWQASRRPSLHVVPPAADSDLEEVSG